MSVTTLTHCWNNGSKIAPYVTYLRGATEYSLIPGLPVLGLKCIHLSAIYLICIRLAYNVN